MNFGKEIIYTFVKIFIHSLCLSQTVSNNVDHICIEKGEEIDNKY